MYVQQHKIQIKTHATLSFYYFVSYHTKTQHNNTKIFSSFSKVGAPQRRYLPNKIISHNQIYSVVQLRTIARSYTHMVRI